MDFLFDYALAEKKQREKIGLFPFIDLFSFAPTPRYYRRRSSSFRSIVASVIMVLIVVGYMVFTVNRFIHAKPQTSVSQVQTKKEAANHTIPEFGVLFQRFLNDDSQIADELGRTTTTLPFWNHSFFKLEVWSTYIDSSGVYHEEEVETQLVEQIEWLGVVGRKVMMPINYDKLVVGGLFTLYRDFRYVEIDVVVCDEEAHNITCASEEEITQLFKQGEFVFATRQLGGHDSEPVIFAQSYSVVYNIWSWYDIAYAPYTIITEPDFVRTFLQKTTNFLKRTYEVLFLVNSWKDGTGGARTFMTWRILLGTEQFYETRSLSNILDVLGMWAALYSALSMGLGMFFKSYNRRKFYKRNPKWDSFDRNLNYLGEFWYLDDNVKNASDADDEEQHARENEMITLAPPKHIRSVDDMNQEMETSLLNATSSPALTSSFSSSSSFPGRKRRVSFVSSNINNNSITAMNNNNNNNIIVAPSSSSTIDKKQIRELVEREITRQLAALASTKLQATEL